jgi:hypothetical protein
MSTFDPPSRLARTFFRPFFEGAGDEGVDIPRAALGRLAGVGDQTAVDELPDDLV